REAIGTRIVGGPYPWRGAAPPPPRRPPWAGGGGGGRGCDHRHHTAYRLDARDGARERAGRGAGEILLTSMDRDGARTGFDLALTRAVVEAVDVPVIASGGVGSLADLVAGIL